MPPLAFDTLEYVHKLKEAGVPEKQAEAQAHALTLVIDNNLATKRDLKELENELKHDIKELEFRLEAKIAENKSEIIKWCVGSVFTSVGLFATVIKLLG